MAVFERVVLAALLHDFDRMPSQVAEAVAPTKWQEVAEDAVGALILNQAEACASATGKSGTPLAAPPLESIFSHVRLDHEPSVCYRSVAALAATKADQSHLFPVQSPPDGDVSAHWELFAQDLQGIVGNIPLDDHERLYSHLLASIQRYLWCLPAHTDHVSLFDHLKIASATAAALYRYHQAQGSLNEQEITHAAGQERFCVLVGDLSGIQDYIFDIASVGAGPVARRLRARSFFISLISDVLAHKIVHDFELPLGNIIMSSGGKFYVLLPGLDDFETRADAIRREVDEWLLEEFNGEIGANLAYARLSDDQFQASALDRTGFGDVMTQLSLALAGKKQQRLHGVLGLDWGGESFVIKKDFGGRGDCPSCGKFPTSEDSEYCPRCSEDAGLGGILPKARYVAYYDSRAESPAKSIELLGEYSVSVLTHFKPDRIGRPYLLVKLNDPDLGDMWAYPSGFRYLANHVPTGEDGSPLLFEDIARGSEDDLVETESPEGEQEVTADQPTGRALLGYVKADVDYLGIIFAQGLRQDQGGQDTISHTAMLSRELDLFFSGWLEHALDKPNAEHKNFYTVFSGGDDLFLVGRWNQAALLAREVNDRFREFVGRNQDLTLSAGILFSKERYPIARAAEDVERALGYSKEREGADGKSRNQLTVLNDTMRWDEASRVFSEIETLSGYAEGLTSSFLKNLVHYGQLYRRYKAGEIEGLRYKALFAWNIARVLREGDPAIREWADSLMQSLDGKGDAHRMQHLDLVATYILFSRRERERGD